MQFSTKLGYGVGQLSDGIKQASFSTFLFFYYNQVLGLSGSLAGGAALIALVVDAFTDPMVGRWSDDFRSRWGRRHPFMLAGALPFGFAIIALFTPPAGLESHALFAWMLTFAITVRIMLTLFFVPHLSLGAEMVTHYHEKTSLIGFRVFFTYAGVLLTSVIGFAVFFPATETYSNGMLNAASYPYFGAFCAVMATAAMLYSTYATRSQIPLLKTPKLRHKEHPILGFIAVFKLLKEQSFRIIFTTSLAFNTLAGLVQTLLIYLATYVFGFEPANLAVVSLSLIVGISLASITAQKLSRRFDKKNALALCVVVGATIAVSPSILYLLGILPEMGLNERLIFIFITNGISQAFFIAYIILLDSMLSDVVDEHYLITGHKDEGLFFSARSLATKASYGLGSFLAGIALDIIKFPQAASPENVPQQAVNSLATVAGPISLILFISTIIISHRYRLTSQRHREISEAIKKRELKESSDSPNTSH
jgi:Na+/melibiose symporter-like transporter